MKLLRIFLVLVIVLGWMGASYANTASAFSYLLSRQGEDGTFTGNGPTGWAVMAHAMHGRENVAAVTSLQAVQRTLQERSATDVEKQILSLVAAGENPRTFAGVDAVAELESRITQGQIGNSEYLNDDMFGILAFRAAGVRVPAMVSDNLAVAQNRDGGWGITKDGASSTDMTAVALLALRSTLSQGAFSQGVAYIKSKQNSDGGFATQSGESNIGSTAWVMWLMNTLGETWEKEGKSPQDFLWSQQLANGSWGESVLLTSYSLMALSGKPFPYVGQVAPSPSPSVTATSTPTLVPSVSPSPVVLLTPNPVVSVVPSPSPSPSMTPAPTPTPAPVATFSSSPTPAPQPSPTVTPAQSATPSPIVARTLRQVRSSPRVTPTASPTAQMLPSPSPSSSEALSFDVAPSPVATVLQQATTLPRQSTVHVGFGILLLTANVGLTGLEIVRAHRKHAQNQRK